MIEVIIASYIFVGTIMWVKSENDIRNVDYSRVVWEAVLEKYEAKDPDTVAVMDEEDAQEVRAIVQESREEVTHYQENVQNNPIAILQIVLLWPVFAINNLRNK